MNSRQAGVTLVEVMMGLLLTAASLAAAIGGFKEQLQQRQTDGVAAEFVSDVQYVRSESVSRNSSLRLGFERDASGARCYVIHTGGAGACRCSEASEPVCEAGDVALKAVRLPADGAVRVEANVASMVFDGTRGTVSPTGTIAIEGRDGRRLHQVVSLVGRVRTCTATGTVRAGERRC